MPSKLKLGGHSQLKISDSRLGSISGPITIHMFVNLASAFWSTALALNLAVTGTSAIPIDNNLADQNIEDVIYSASADTTDAQSFTVSDSVKAPAIERESYSITAPPPPPPPEPVVVETPVKSKTSVKSSGVPSTPSAPAVTPNPGSAQEEAWNQVQAHGWGQSEFNCLVSLWNKESGWRVNANNPSSGAYGIPQALPGSKMASAGADWQTNPGTQIKWGLGYISSRYGTPCGAWGHSQASNWY